MDQCGGDQKFCFRIWCNSSACLTVRGADIGVTVSPVSRSWHWLTRQLLTVLTTLHMRLTIIVNTSTYYTAPVSPCATASASRHVLSLHVAGCGLVTFLPTSFDVGMGCVLLFDVTTFKSLSRPSVI